MTIALLVATDDGGEPEASRTGPAPPVAAAAPASPVSSRPSAAVPVGSGTVLERLRGQLAALGVRRQLVVTRPGHARQLHGADDVDVYESPRVADDLRWVARGAREAQRAGEPVAVLSADLLCHRTVLDELVTDPGAAARALVRTGPAATAAVSPPVRVEGRRVASAGSAYHRVGEPNGCFLGGVRAGVDRADAVADAAQRLAELAEREPLDDVPALVLVGLAREGRPVDAIDVRRLHCRRVADAEAAATADAEIRAVDEERVLLDAAVKADDGFFTTHCVSPYSRHIAQWAARRGLTPNIVTTVSLGIGLGSAACFALGTRAGLVAGALALQAAFTADCVDGQLARYTRRFSAFGGWLDSVSDRAKEYAVYAGLAVGAATSGVGSVWGLAVAALSLQTVRHLVDFCYAAAHSGSATLPVRPVEELDDGSPPRRTAGGDDAAAGAPDGCRRAGGAVGTAVGTAAALSRRLEARPATRWLKKIIVLPIGERFALISVTAALFHARVTFVALLAWGGLAAAYSLGGRVLRALADGGKRSDAGVSAAAAYRDDGPLAAAVCATGMAAIVPHALRSRWRKLDWLVPPSLRAGEFAVVGALGLAGGAPPALVFALLAAVAYHQYDTVYRVRQRLGPPPAWVHRAGLGWDGRMLVAALGAAGGVATPVYAGLTAGLWVLFAGESLATWVRGVTVPDAAAESEGE